MRLAEDSSNTRPLTPVSDDREDLQELTPNQFLLGTPVVVEHLRPDSVRYEDLRNLSEVAQAYNRMSCNRWMRHYLPKCKWPNADESLLKIGDLFLLTQESVRRHENKMSRVTEMFPGADCVI